MPGNLLSATDASLQPIPASNPMQARRFKELLRVMEARSAPIVLPLPRDRGIAGVFIDATFDATCAGFHYNGQAVLQGVRNTTAGFHKWESSFGPTGVNFAAGGDVLLQVWLLPSQDHTRWYGQGTINFLGSKDAYSLRWETNADTFTVSPLAPGGGGVSFYARGVVP
jgi:hypothetical protein